jgi:ribonuclease E
MSKKMLIDATHPEETRIVVVDGVRVEEFDYETSARATIGGNIYLAKITRVEPSLQAAFVDYGGGRHGFLPFSEIHPDYFQIPQADRDALIAAVQQAEEQAAREEEAVAHRRRNQGRRSAAQSGEAEPKKGHRRGRGDSRSIQLTQAHEQDVLNPILAACAESGPIFAGDAIVTNGAPFAPALADIERLAAMVPPLALEAEASVAEATVLAAKADFVETISGVDENIHEKNADAATVVPAENDATQRDNRPGDEEPEKTTNIACESDANQAETEEIEETEEASDDDGRESFSRDAIMHMLQKMKGYKIQEVIKRRQILLVQAVKEERGNKGAALTTYLSLAGRYCVLMPNTARGGGISRKITNIADRKRLKSVVSAFEVSDGMGLIIRTAGANRTAPDLRRDYEYLLRQWSAIRDLTMKSVAPALIYEEGGLIKRSIRDLFNSDIDQIQVEGPEAFNEAREYMSMLMPGQAKEVAHYRGVTPLFSKYQVESQITGLLNPSCTLKSGGYIVIGITEALVAIDVNSGRSTKEASIENTALKTNLEAVDEIARQLRLRDLAGLIVIDFIDMEDPKNNRAVEKRLKDQLKNDRARIQMGRISSFGLLEMSRQRLRPGFLEATTVPCEHCRGLGVVQSREAHALSLLRAIEETAGKGRLARIAVVASVPVVNYLLNAKRHRIAELERYLDLDVVIEADTSMEGPDFSIEKVKSTVSDEDPRPATAVQIEVGYAEPEPEPEEEKGPDSPSEPAEHGSDDSSGRKRRGRRGGRKRRRSTEDSPDPLPVIDLGDEDAVKEPEAAPVADEAIASIGEPATVPKKSRRRGGGRGKAVTEPTPEPGETVIAEAQPAKDAKTKSVVSTSQHSDSALAEEKTAAVAANQRDGVFVADAASGRAAELVLAVDDASAPVRHDEPASTPVSNKLADLFPEAPKAEPATEVVTSDVVNPPKKGWWGKRKSS